MLPRDFGDGDLHRACVAAARDNAARRAPAAAEGRAARRRGDGGGEAGVS
jgi:hypothetical protein